MIADITAAAVANVISVFALVLAAIVFCRQTKTDHRQTEAGTRQAELAERMTTLEEERRQDEVGDRRSAKLSIRFVKYRNRMGQEFIIANHGPAEARNIDLVATSRENPEWVDDLIARGPMPIASIQAYGATRTPATGRQSVGQPYEIEVSWEDDRPGRHQASHTVSIELLEH